MSSIVCMLKKIEVDEKDNFSIWTFQGKYDDNGNDNIIMERDVRLIESEKCILRLNWCCWMFAVDGYVSTQLRAPSTASNAHYVYIFIAISKNSGVK